MALASNTRDQLALRLRQNIERLAPEWAVSASHESGDPAIKVTEDSDTIAAIVIRRKSFVGLNIVAELSSSAAEGLPEHDVFLVIKDDLSPAKAAKLTKAATLLGCASLKVCEKAAPSASDAAESSVTAEIPNSADFGAVGL